MAGQDHGFLEARVMILFFHSTHQLRIHPQMSLHHPLWSTLSGLLESGIGSHLGLTFTEAYIPVECNGSGRGNRS